MRWLIGLLAMTACHDELSFGRLRASDASTCGVPSFAVPQCHALCSCGDFVSSGSSTIEGAAAVGGLLSAGDVRVNGPLTLSGVQGAALTGDLQVTGTFQDRGPLQGSHDVAVQGDAFCAGEVRLRRLQVSGRFTLAEGAALEGEAPIPTRAAVSVQPECDCTPAFDIGAQIDLARAQNDNAAIDLGPELRTFDEARTVDLPCGRYHLAQIYAGSPIRLNVHGRVALYVDQRIVTESAGSLTIQLDDGAQLELLIRGGVTGAGPITIAGGEAHLYVGGGDSFFFAAPTSIAGTLYAPNSELVTQQRFSLTGAALLKRVVAESELNLKQTTPRCP